jgi:DNA-binding NarL/FixJ family response regulator
MKITLLIVDDHELVRSGVRKLVEGTEIDVVGEASSGAEAVELVERLRPDVMLLDIRMPQGDGLDVLERVREIAPQTKVVVLSTYDNPTYIARAISLGAVDYVTKGAMVGQIVESIRAAAGVGDAPPSEPARRVVGVMSSTMKQPEPEFPLTRRESQVLRHLALGLSNKDIGRSLNISVDTVKEHVQNLLRKIHATDRTQAAVWAVKKKLV